MNKEQLEQVVKQLDLTDVAYKLSQLALKTISGKEIERKEYVIKISIPVEIGELFEILGEKTGIKAEELLSHMAVEGFNRSLQNKINETKKPNESINQNEIEKMAKSVNIDISELTEGLGKIKDLTGQLNELQGVIENVGKTETTKNPSKPSISLRPISKCGKPGKK